MYAYVHALSHLRDVVDAAPARDAAAGRITLTEATRRMRISVKTLKRVMEKNGLNVTNCNRRK